MVWPLFRYVLLAAVRDKLLIAMIGLVAVVLSLSAFFGGSVIVEQDQFARTFSAYGFRLFGVFTLAMFVISFVRRGFETRDMEYLLSRPIGRVRFVLTHAAAFSFLAVLCAFVLGAFAMLMSAGNYHEGVWLWWLSIAVEYIIVANVAMFFAFAVSSTTLCLAFVSAFYLLSRLMGDILGVLANTQDSVLMKFLARMMEVISIFIPRLDLMGQTQWILYGVPDNISLLFIIGQGAAFCAVVLGACILDIHKRQF